MSTTPPNSSDPELDRAIATLTSTIASIDKHMYRENTNTDHKIEEDNEDAPSVVSEIFSAASSVETLASDVTTRVDGSQMAQLGRLMARLARRVSVEKFKELVGATGILGDDYLEYWARFALQRCSQTDILHTYDRFAKCLSCEKQICKDCRFCVSDWVLAPEGQLTSQAFQDRIIAKIHARHSCSNCSEQLSLQLPFSAGICECIDLLNRRFYENPAEVPFYHCLDCAEEITSSWANASQDSSKCHCGQQATPINEWPFVPCRICQKWCDPDDIDGFVGDEGDS